MVLDTILLSHEESIYLRDCATIPFSLSLRHLKWQTLQQVPLLQFFLCWTVQGLSSSPFLLLHLPSQLFEDWHSGSIWYTLHFIPPYHHHFPFPLREY